MYMTVSNTLRKRVPENAASGKASGKLPEKGDANTYFQVRITKCICQGFLKSVIYILYIYL